MTVIRVCVEVVPGAASPPFSSIASCSGAENPYRPHFLLPFLNWRPLV